jgi:hypothetical protein
MQVTDSMKLFISEELLMWRRSLQSLPVPSALQNPPDVEVVDGDADDPNTQAEQLSELERSLDL